MRVREIMTKDVGTATLDSTVEDVTTMMKDDDVGAIPVLDDGELAGIVTDRDIVVRCIAEGKDPAETTVEDILTEELHTIEPDADVDEAARIMADRQIRRLPVVEEGELIGVVSLGDIAVKQGDTETAGESLQDISEGVKQERGSRSKRHKSGGEQRQKGRASEERMEGRGRTLSGAGRETEGRRAKVTPIRGRKEGKASGRRKTG
ncbi:MAG TPA: CBS domain-containing protein [Terriglobales bacterium]|nr:CBS domain-containing protein [Terriglobales bacterium]